MDPSSAQPPHAPPATPAPPGHGSDELALTQAAHALVASIRADARTRHLQPPVPPASPAGHPASVPDLHAIEELLALARRLVFPGFFDRQPLRDQDLPDITLHLTARLAAHLHEQVRGVLRYVCGSNPAAAWPDHPATPDEDPHTFWAPWRTRLHRAGLIRPGQPIDCEPVARQATHHLLAQLPELRRLLSLDVQAAFEGDPAAEHTDEIILCYPGLLAVFHHRLAHELYRLGIPLLPRIISETAHRLTGIDIHPGARIGQSFFVDHGAGTVIGETTVIGDHAKIYQGVTLGAKSFPKDERGRLIRGAKRHPSLGHRVTVYAGAVILGGDTTIGDDSVVTGGVFLTMPVPPGHIVRQKQPELVMRSNPELRT
jgi:serine O-acetyltransferase